MTLKASDWIWTGNTHVNGTLEDRRWCQGEHRSRQRDGLPRHRQRHGHRPDRQCRDEENRSAMKRSSTAKSTLISLSCAMLLPALLFSQNAIVKRPSAPSLKKGEKQLFVDELMIRRKQGVTRVVHPAKKLEHPVLEAEMPWEVRDTERFPGQARQHLRHGAAR